MSGVSCVDSCVTLACDVVSVCSAAVAVWSVCGQLAASASRTDGGGRCSITSLSSCLYRGSWIYLSVGLSDSPPRRVEVCDREMERDGGWTGRVRADCLSVMNINGLRVSLSSSGSPALKTDTGWGCGEGGGPSSFPPSRFTRPLAALYVQNTHKYTQSYTFVFFLDFISETLSTMKLHHSNC